MQDARDTTISSLGLIQSYVCTLMPVGRSPKPLPLPVYDTYLGADDVGALRLEAGPSLLSD